MLKFTEYVNASAIWPTAKDFEDKGYIPGLVRGYNLEVKKGDKVDWMAAEWINGNPEEEFDDEFHNYFRQDMGLELTGRICFRGYATEHYDSTERDWYVVLCDENGVILKDGI